MSIGLSSDLEQFVQQELASGRYASPEEVISEGLRRMRDAQQEYEQLASGDRGAHREP